MGEQVVPEVSLMEELVERAKGMDISKQPPTLEPVPGEVEAGTLPDYLKGLLVLVGAIGQQVADVRNRVLNLCTWCPDHPAECVMCPASKQILGEHDVLENEHTCAEAGFWTSVRAKFGVGPRYALRPGWRVVKLPQPEVIIVRVRRAPAPLPPCGGLSGFCLNVHGR